MVERKAPQPRSAALGMQGGDDGLDAGAESGGSRLGFIRLKCFSVSRTIKFYTTCLGFDLKRKSELEEGAVTMVFLTPKASEEFPLDLRFECERYKQMKYSKVAKVPVCTTSRIKLVFYVRDMRSALLSVERSATGSWVFSLPQRHASVLIAVVVDPNGILVELVEMSDSLLKVPPQFLSEFDKVSRQNENHHSNQGPVRFGYATIRSPAALEHARYYEALFRPRLDTRKGQRLARKNRSSMAQQTQGIHIVDKEDFPELLASFVWIGSGPRSHCSTVCFVHKIERQGLEVPRLRFAANTTKTVRQNPHASFSHRRESLHPDNSDPATNHSTSFRTRGHTADAAKKAFHFLMEAKSAEEIDPFIGIGIFVNDLLATRSRLERHTRYSITFIDEPHEQEAVGRLCSFADEHGVLVQLVDNRSAMLIDLPKDQPFAKEQVRKEQGPSSDTQRNQSQELNSSRDPSSTSSPSSSRVFPSRVDRIVDPRTRYDPRHPAPSK